MRVFQDLRNKMFLCHWTGKKFLDKEKRIRISRSSTYYHADVIDLTWSLRYIKADGTNGHPTVFSERTNGANLVRTIRYVEKHVIPGIIAGFKAKLSTKE